MTRQIYQEIAAQLARKQHLWSEDIGARRLESMWIQIVDCDEKIRALMDSAPSGSGIDNGVQLLEDESHDNRLVFQCDFHHMDESGFYSGWTYHTAVVTPDLAFGYSLRITGRDRNQIKEYLGETLGYWLDTLWADQSTGEQK